MYNTKFILNNGKFIYPGYLDKEQRELLKKKYENEREYMRCGCKPQGDLFYRFSEDCRIYPEHNNYAHEKSCCRYKDSSGNRIRQTGYAINEDDGEVTAYLSFNPKTFSVSEASGLKDANNDVPEQEEDSYNEEIFIEKDDTEQPAQSEREPNLSLEELIRSINVDSFTEKVINNQDICSKVHFSKFVYNRMKRVHIPKMKRSLGELSLEKDGVRFFYLPLADILVDKNSGYKKCYIKTVSPEGKIFSNFIFEKTLDTALKKFQKQYDMMPNQETMVAGFQYLKKVSNNGKKSSYRVFGRIHLFLTSEIGIYCKNVKEKNVFDKLTQIRNEHPDFKFWIPPEDNNIGCIINIKGKDKKILLLFKRKKTVPFVYDSSIYVPYVVDNYLSITYEQLYNLI